MGAVFTFGILAGLLLLLGGLLVGAALLVTGLVLKRRYKKHENSDTAAKKGKRGVSIALIVTGCCVLAVPVCFVIGVTVTMIADRVGENKNLGVNVVNGQYEKASELLASGVNPDCTKESNRQAEDGEYTLLAYLISNGFDTYPSEYGGYSYPDRDDRPAEKLAMERLLLDYGADPDYRVVVEDSDKELPHTPAEAANGEITNGYHDCGKTPLLLAVKYGDLASVKLLVEYGADIQAVDDCGYNAILVAASQLEDDTGVEMLEYLIGQGCDVEAVNNFGQNAMDILDSNAEQEYVLPEDVPQQDEMRALLETYMED